MNQSIEILVNYFRGNKLWYNITQNEGVANSCLDATRKRRRLGNVGIPLADEMKTELGVYKQKNEDRFVLLHCRGNNDLHIGKIKQYFSTTYERLHPDKTRSIFNLQKGLINPFTFALDYPEVLQVFDFDLFSKKLPPYTLMTNASDKNWAIEFRPGEVFDAIPNAVKADIIVDSSRRLIQYHKIGILTGNSPESGVFLWQTMNNCIREKLDKNRFLGDISFPEVCIESLPGMGYSMELDLRINETVEVIRKGVLSLCRSGAKLVAIACNTSQYFADMVNEVCKEYNAEFISMPAVVEEYLKKTEIIHFDFLGIKYVTDFKYWSGFKNLAQLYKVEVPSENDLNKINQLAFMVKQKSITESSRNQLRHLIMKSAKTNVVIIALTEISILLASQKDKGKSGRVFIDTLTLLAEELASRFVNGIKDVSYAKTDNYEEPNNSNLGEYNKEVI